MNNNQIEFINRFSTTETCLFACSAVIDFIACQFALESNFGTSHLAKMCNNFCGMKKPWKRLGFYEVDDDGFPISYIGFATYESFELCFMDYVCWLSYKQFDLQAMNNLDSFIIQLRNSGYCPERDYIDKITSIYNSFKNYKNGQKE